MIKTLSKQIKGFVKESVLTPVFMILEVVFETLIPLLMASIIDDGINKGDMNHILFVGGGMVLCAIGGLICGILGGSFGAKASAGFARNLRRSMFANIQTFSFSNIDIPASIISSSISRLSLSSGSVSSTSRQLVPPIDFSISNKNSLS